MAGSKSGLAESLPTPDRAVRPQFLVDIWSRLFLGLMFFAVVTPAGLVMRLAGRDALRLRFSPPQPSYWIPRTSRGGKPTSMVRQF